MLAEADDVAALSAERAEARHIARWLYDRSPAMCLFIRDVSEWPWLLDPNPVATPALQRLAEADRDRLVLRALAVLQAVGDDPYDAQVTRTMAQRQGVRRLRQTVSSRGGLVTGGQLFSRSFVETVTHEGMAAAGMLDSDGHRDAFFAPT